MATYLHLDTPRCCSSHTLVTFYFREQIPTSSDDHSQAHPDISGLRLLCEHTEAPEKKILKRGLNISFFLKGVNFINIFRAKKLQSQNVAREKLRTKNVDEIDARLPFTKEGYIIIYYLIKVFELIRFDLTLRKLMSISVGIGAS